MFLQYVFPKKNYITAVFRVMGHTTFFFFFFLFFYLNHLYTGTVSTVHTRPVVLRTAQ